MKDVVLLLRYARLRVNAKLFYFVHLTDRIRTSKERRKCVYKYEYKAQKSQESLVQSRHFK